MKSASAKYLIGIDEVGRGPLAGPVVVAAVKIEKTLQRRLLKGIRDSKRLTPKQREEWFLKITRHPQVRWASSRVAPKIIDRINILKAAELAAKRVYKRLTYGKRDNLSSFEHEVLLDGGLKLPKGILFVSIIKGDEKIPVIAAASIIAKVIRDRMMLRHHLKFPQYRFDLHKGYGTVLHRELLNRYGHSPTHRLSFLKKISNV